MELLGYLVDADDHIYLSCIFSESLRDAERVPLHCLLSFVSQSCNPAVGPRSSSYQLAMEYTPVWLTASTGYTGPR